MKNKDDEVFFIELRNLKLELTDAYIFCYLVEYTFNKGRIVTLITYCLVAFVVHRHKYLLLAFAHSSIRVYVGYSSLCYNFHIDPCHSHVLRENKHLIF